MEYSCLVAGDASVGIGALVHMLLESPLPAALREKQQQQQPPLVSAQDLPAAERTLTLPNPSLPQMDIRVRFEVAETPPSEADFGSGAPEAALFVFSVFASDSLRRLQKEWAPLLKGLRPAPSVILVGMTNNSLTATATIPPNEIAIAAREVHAKGYFEVEDGTSSGSAVAAELRIGVARACTGELLTADDVQESTIHDFRQRTAMPLSLRSNLSLTSGCPSPLDSWGYMSRREGAAVAAAAAATTSPVWGYRRHPRSNRVFYVNRVTRKSQYRRPPDYDGEEPELTLEERVEAERERQMRLQRESELQREHEELMRFNEEMEEQQQRLRVKQSCARRLDHEVERLRLHASSLRRQCESNKINRSQLAQLRDEVRAKEEAFLQESMQFRVTLQQQLTSAQEALKEEEIKGPFGAIQTGSDSVFVVADELERDRLHAEMQATVDGTRAAVAKLREVLLQGITLRERNATLHTELTATLKSTEKLLLQMNAIDAEEQRIRAALPSAKRELEDAQCALRPLLAAHNERRQWLRTQRQMADRAGLQEELLTDEVQRLDLELATLKENTLSICKSPAALGEAYEYSRLQRSRDLRACVTAHSMFAACAVSIPQLRQRLEEHLQRHLEMQQSRQKLTGEVRERYVQERLSLLHQWYALDAAESGTGNDSATTQLCLVEERMEQLDSAIEQLQTYSTVCERGTSNHRAKLQRAHDLLERSSSLCAVEGSSKLHNTVEACWQLLSERLRLVMSGLKSSVVIDEGAVEAAADSERSASYTEHIALLQQDLWRCAAQSLLRHFSPAELQRAVRSLSCQRTAAVSGMHMASVCSSIPSGSNDGERGSNVRNDGDSGGSGDEPTVTWVEDLLLSVLAPVVKPRGLSDRAALVEAAERATARRSASVDVLRKRMRQVYT
ncbi:hypothetical protein DQ04_00301010 [Trypanosoma grayi]|uniref:hypothetical protein n=1 Tax=Trypanosoma grayi TaxID=71804 RepID=UPI0004F40966|nr:hypothetical protein DQ04_00301010 [Trypanosoma grayi]KEG14791.1 hypothetical protein DQ04_00301010 [Trypanosoma grayi]